MSSVISPETEVIPNWRPLKREHTDVESILAIHPPWSEREYTASLELYDRFMNCTDSYVAPGIKDALNCLEHAYRLYGPESVICSYNGGKDAVVILHLMRAAHAQYFRSYRESNDLETLPCRPRVIYFDHKDEFPEILALLHDTVVQYDLDMVAFESGVSFSEGLQRLVDNNIPCNADRPYPLAFVLGTRTTDPNAGSQGQFAPSSHYMPPFMRVNPVLEWSYGEVWHFLRLFRLPYCSLYDEGYTSLGTVKDTEPCPALAVAGSRTNGTTTSSVPRYWPAYMLRDWDQERAGRITKEQLKKKRDSKPEPKQQSQPQSPPAAAADTNDKPPMMRSPSGSIISSISGIGAGEVKDPRVGASVQVPPPPISGSSSSSTSSTNPSFSSDATQRSVGLLVIGDEILKGMTADTNTHTAAKALREHNVPLTRVVVVSDDPNDIVAEIKRMQSEVDVIITSGGVGPTHDDVTIKSVAAALNRELVWNEEMAQLLRRKMKSSSSEKEKEDDELLTEAQRKMAMLPARSQLRYLSTDTTSSSGSSSTNNKSKSEDWPVLQCRNIFVLPGVPEFFSKKMVSLSAYLSSQLERSVAHRVVLSVDEPSIVQALNQVVERHPQVVIGCYPFVSHPEFKTVVTLEGRMMPSGISGGPLTRNSSIFLDRKTLQQQQALMFSKAEMDLHVREALDFLITVLPQGSILRVENDDDSGLFSQ